MSSDGNGDQKIETYGKFVAVSPEWEKQFNAMNQWEQDMVVSILASNFAETERKLMSEMMDNNT